MRNSLSISTVGTPVDHCPGGTPTCTAQNLPGKKPQCPQTRVSPGTPGQPVTKPKTRSSSLPEEETRFRESEDCTNSERQIASSFVHRVLSRLACVPWHTVGSWIKATEENRHSKNRLLRLISEFQEQTRFITNSPSGQQASSSFPKFPL